MIYPDWKEIERVDRELNDYFKANAPEHSYFLTVALHRYDHMYHVMEPAVCTLSVIGLGLENDCNILACAPSDMLEGAKNIMAQVQGGA